MKMGVYRFLTTKCHDLLVRYRHGD